MSIVKDMIYSKVIRPVVKGQGQMEAALTFVEIVSLYPSIYYKNVYSLLVSIRGFEKSYKSGIFSNTEKHTVDDYHFTLFNDLAEKISSEYETMELRNKYLNQEYFINLLDLFEDKGYEVAENKIVTFMHRYSSSCKYSFYISLGNCFENNSTVSTDTISMNKKSNLILNTIRELERENLILTNNDLYFEILNNDFFTDASNSSDFSSILNWIIDVEKNIIQFFKKIPSEPITSNLAFFSRVDTYLTYLNRDIANFIFEFRRVQKDSINGILSALDKVKIEMKLIIKLITFLEDDIVSESISFLKDDLGDLISNALKSNFEILSDNGPKKNIIEFDKSIILSIRDEIEEGELESALNLFLKEAKRVDSNLIDELIVLKSLYQRNKKNERLGIDYQPKYYEKTSYDLISLSKSLM